MATSPEKVKIWPKILFKKSCLIFLGFFGVLLVLEIILQFCPVSEGFRRMPLDNEHPIPHNRANRDLVWSKGYNFEIVVRKHSNNYGFLNDIDYFENEKTPLVAVIGDSYIEAGMVPTPLTIHGILAEKTGGNGRSYSFAVGGSQLATYTVLAKYARDLFKPNMMVFLIVGNDFDQSIMKRTGFYHFSRQADGKWVLERADYKPALSRQLLRKSALTRYIMLNILSNPVRMVLETMFERDRKTEESFVGNTSADAHKQRIDDANTVIDVFLDKILDASGLEPGQIIFVLDGMRPHIYSQEMMRHARGSYFDIVRQDFTGKAESKGFTVIDMQPIFAKKNRADGSRFEFPIDSHWNALAHSLAAEAVAQTATFSNTFSVSISTNSKKIMK